MHADLQTDDLRLMLSDAAPMGDVPAVSNVALSLSGEDDAKLTGYFTALSDGGTVKEPLVAAPWGDKFGMLVDKFGTNWLVNISAPKAV